MNFKTIKSLLLVSILALCGSIAAAANTDEPVGDVERITIEELKSKLVEKQDIVIIDVRGKDFDASETKIKGAIRIVPDSLSSSLESIPRGKEIVTYCACATDGGAVKAAQTLLANGFKRVRALKGGWNAWVQAGGAVEPK
jgi:rhodanese-related sulfurtransferase